MPARIAGPHVVDGLFVVAIVSLVVDYLAFLARRRASAALGLGVFSLINVSALGHYLYAPMSALTPKMNVLIWLEAVAARVLMAFVALFQRSWSRVVRR